MIIVYSYWLVSLAVEWKVLKFLSLVTEPLRHISSKPSPYSLHELNSLNVIITYSFFRTRNVLFFKSTVNRVGYPLRRGITEKNLFFINKNCVSFNFGSVQSSKDSMPRVVFLLKCEIICHKTVSLIFPSV